MDTRVWHGKNGKHFRGKFLGREGEILRIQSTRGKIYNVPVTSLSDDDRKWLESAWVAHQEAESKIEALIKPGTVVIKKDHRFSDVAPIGFEEIPDDKIVRANVPLLNPKDYKSSNYNNTSASLVPFFSWWHNYRLLNIPARRDDNEKRLEWLYKELGRLNFGGNRSMDPSHLHGFCNERLKAKAYFEILDMRDGRSVNKELNVLDRFSPQFMSRYVKGANATILALTLYEGSRSRGTSKVPLVECSPAGEVTFYIYGDIKLKGRLIKLPFDKKKAKASKDRLPRYEISISNMSDAEEWFQNREYSFFLEGADENGLIVIKPYKSQQLDKDVEDDNK